MEAMHDGRPCPDYIQKMFGQPRVLRARATVRRVIADQDLYHADTWAHHRNLQIAQELEERANAVEGG